MSVSLSFRVWPGHESRKRWLLPRRILEPWARNVRSVTLTPFTRALLRREEERGEREGEGERDGERERVRERGEGEREGGGQGEGEKERGSKAREREREGERGREREKDYIQVLLNIS